MKRWLWATLLGVLSSTPAFAQLGSYRPPQVNPTPVVSPFLNLANNPASMYFGIIQPQMAMYQNLQGLQQQVRVIEENRFSQLGFSAVQPAPDNLPTTGHPVVFQNLSYYYPALSRDGTGNRNRAGVFKYR